MDILPQNYKEFKDKKYWDHFFSSLKNTQNQFFQWYGAYSDYKHLLSELVPPTFSIFHVGCGKSTFSEDLFKESPKLRVINCDYSENVINEMKQRSQKRKIDMEYVVCDLLEPLGEKFINKFDLVLDKGTLDAMLPEDSIGSVTRIKESYFPNIQMALKKEGGSFIIISLLQPFVLRTVLEHYAFRPKYQVEIYECLIKDSKLQPFLVYISVHPTQEEKHVLFHPLAKKQVTKWTTTEEVLSCIETLQKEVTHSEKIKELSAGRRTKFNLYSQQNRKDIRYLVEVVDSESKQALSKNTCSIFIVPQGKENSYLYNDDAGIKYLHSQVNSSRLILVKLIAGGEFNNLEQIKKQLNLVMADFVQQGCDPKKAAYLTDADQLGQRRYLFQNEELILDEVVVEGEPIRRLFLRSAPIIPQCQFKLTYLSEANNKQLKQICSKILPAKKNMVIGIDKQEMFDDSARFIYTGLNAFAGNFQANWKVLILGCQLALAKFLLQQHQGIQITVVTGDYKTAKQLFYKYLQLQDSERLQIFCISPAQYFNENPQQKFNIVIQTTLDKHNAQNPSPSRVSKAFQEKIVKLLQIPGLYVCHYRDYQMTPCFNQVFFPVYGSKSSSKEENIVFCLTYPKKLNDGKLVIHENLVKFKPKIKHRYDWEEENFKDIGMLQPNISVSEAKQIQFNKEALLIDKQGVFEDLYGNIDDKSQKKANKKKKKKK